MMLDRSPIDRLQILDGLRGFAILMVVWYHLWLVSGYTVPLLGFAQIVAQNGFLGVDLFFFLSGFCIALPYARARTDGRSLPRLVDFARKRALKIVPSYLLALAIFGVAFADRFDGPGALFAHLAAHVAFVHVFFPATFGSFSGPLWTLAVEVQFYALFAVSAPFVVRRPYLAYAVLVAIATVYRTAIAAIGVDDDFGWINQLPAVLDVFGAGMVGAFVFAARPGDTTPLRKPVVAAGVTFVALALLVVALDGVTAAAASGGDAAVHRWIDAWRGAFGPVLLAATLGLAAGPRALRDCVAVRPLRGLSTVSYAAYLFNLEIAVAFARIGLPGPVVFWLGAAGTLAVSALVTHGFERPIQRNAVGPIVRSFVRRLRLPRLRESAESVG